MLSHRQLATVRTYAQLISVLRARSDELEITRKIIDEEAKHLSPGYSGKLLSRTPVKNLGPSSFGALLGVLGLALVVVEDERPVALPKRKNRRRQRNATELRVADHSSDGAPNAALSNAGRRAALLNLPAVGRP
jgi:hypothetical protein